MRALSNTLLMIFVVVFAMACATTSKEPTRDSEPDAKLELESMVDMTETPEPSIEEPTEVSTETDAINQPAVMDSAIVEVTETFYRLRFNSDSNVYERTQTNEARPGNLIELVVLAQNKSDITVREVELNNTVPTGPVTLIPESIKTDVNNSIYRISRNGQTFFPADAELDSSDIRFIQWVILELEPEETIELSYRFTVNR